MQQVGRYQILGELGRGAMGIVYKAQDPAIGRTLAIKSIRLTDLSEETERERLRERLFREAQSAGILSHPGIVTIYDIFEENGLAYILMEFVNGPPLEKMLRAEQTPDKDTLLSILRQTASALDYAHRKGIIHRDIKPANIMIHEDGTAKVTDFGVAKITSQHMTAAGTLMGTPSYMSPEQIEGKIIDGRIDQFSLAIIAYEALTGEKPFTAEYLPTLLFKIVREEPPLASRLNPTLAAKADTVFRRAMAKNPDDRFPGCFDFVEALAEALNAIPGWTPLPRGASQHITTVGSQDTVDGSLADTVAAPLEETLATKLMVPHELPHAEPPPSHILRNIVIGAAMLAIAGAAVYLGQRRPPSESAQGSPAPVASGAPDPTPVATEPAPPTPPPTPPAPIAPRAPTESQFELTSTPAGASVIFDGLPETECKSPCKVTLPNGRHTFIVSAPGYRDVQRIFEVPRDPGMIINLERMTGTLNLITTPPGLTVVLDGQEQSGKTPATFQLAPGTHKVSLLRGTEHHDFTVDIKDAGTLTRTIEWQ